MPICRPVRRALTLAVGVALVAVMTASAALAAARWTEDQAVQALMTSAWPDDRIVVDATCLGLDGSYAGATRFACQMKISHRPATIPAAQWSAAVAAIRSNDPQRVAEVMGIPAGASKATLAAIVHRWGLDRTQPAVTGLRVTGAKRSVLFPSPLSSSDFASAKRAQKEVRSAIPAIEAYYSDNGTYAGMTLPALRRIDYGISSRLRIAYADRNGYCASVTVGAVTWSYRGPAGPLVMGHCR